jgi:uracil-DNA glycosylase
MKNLVNLHGEWQEVLKEYVATDDFKKLLNFVSAEYTNKQVFPPESSIFNAFDLTPFSKVKVVILGQDPYHNDGQAHGFSFSVQESISLPPSLKNIYKEIESDLGLKKDFKNGNLENWAKQGVFLLNAILTVVAHSPASHQKKGWEQFTDTVIKTISEKHEYVVFMLWGNYARSKIALIDVSKHLVLVAPHPSPLSAYTGFFGCKHFSKCNDYLRKHGKDVVNF